MVYLKLYFIKFIFFSSTVILSFLDGAHSRDDLVAITVGTERTHGFNRFMRSAEVYNVPVKVLGMGQKWKGGDMNYAGGGHKINMLRKELEEMMKGDQDTIVLFTDSYDIIYLSEPEKIIEKFKSFEDTRVLFSAEQLCWPDTSLALKYPDTKVSNPYLNSGGFIGYLPELYKIVTHHEVENSYDDQLYFTKIYLNKDIRESLQIKLDHKAEIFQNLNGAYSDITLHANKSVEWPYIQNSALNSTPMIVHGNGPAKVALNSLGNYVANAWSPSKGCVYCSEIRKTFTQEELPIVLLAVFVETPTPFFEEFIKTIDELDYPKSKIFLFFRNNVEFHEEEVEEYIKNKGQEYASTKRIKPSDFIEEPEARNLVRDRCNQTACEYLLVVDSLSRLEPQALRVLLQVGQDVVAPLLLRPAQAWSNFWGALSTGGFYARSIDYMDIVNYNIRGLWNVPFITNCYLMKATVLKNNTRENINYHVKGVDSDMAFCAALRNLGIFMFVYNEEELGHLINPETFDITSTHPDMYQIFENKLEWEIRYLHADYADNFKKDNVPKQPCPDVFWFPMVTMRFCKEFIEIMENFGQWSDGSNDDKRLKGGYEAVPTRDIHMNQVGLERHWLYILKEYVSPLQEKVFLGYYHDPPTSYMNFVVRYRPDEQPSLRPHHDTSTYTINLALNTPDVDYTGGGCRFLRYNCSVRNTRPGWLLMHPGRLTHFHEGLKVTNGTRYIMISFIDP